MSEKKVTMAEIRKT